MHSISSNRRDRQEWYRLFSNRWSFGILARIRAQRSQGQRPPPECPILLEPLQNADSLRLCCRVIIHGTDSSHVGSVFWKLFRVLIKIRALGSTSCLFILVSPSLFHCTIQESPDPAEGVQSPASGGTQFIAECDLPTAKVPAAFICCAQFPTIG